MVFGTQGVGGLNRGTQNVGLNGLQQDGQQGTDLQKITQLFEQLLRATRGDQQAQGAQGAQGGQQAGGQQGGMSLEELMRELQRMARENPEAFKQAMQQNPAFFQVAQAALSGGGGGGSVGAIRN